MPADFIPILIQIAVIIGVAASILIMSALFGPKKPAADKLDVYECGVPPLAPTRVRMSVKYYITAVIFVLFDVEVIFIYPWAVIFKKLTAHTPIALYAMFLFLFILVVGLLYELKKGALEWD